MRSDRGIQRPAHDCIPADCDRMAQLITQRSIIGDELRLLAPTRSAAYKRVSGSRITVPAADARCGRSDHGCVSGDRDGNPEIVIGGPVTGGEFLLLAPARPAAHKHVGLARTASTKPSTRGAGYCRLPANRDIET